MLKQARQRLALEQMVMRIDDDDDDVGDDDVEEMKMMMMLTVKDWPFSWVPQMKMKMMMLVVQRGISPSAPC